jgi:hypothetical protein
MSAIKIFILPSWMTQLFGEKTVFLYGKVHGSSFYTPTRKYKIEQVKQAAGMHPVKLDGEPKVFFIGQIFNSYLLSAEENVSRLYAIDGKVTVAKDHIEANRLYTFRVVEESETVRVAALYNNDVLFPGYSSKGTVFYAKTARGEERPYVRTRLGAGAVILQNNERSEEIDVLLYRTDGRLHFVQVNKPISGLVTVQVAGQIGKGVYKVVWENVRGILNTSREHEVGDSVECDVQSVELGYYFFAEHVLLAVGSTVEARVVKRLRDRVLLTCSGREGYMLLPPGAQKTGSVVRGTVLEMDGERFVLGGRLREGELSVPFELEEESSSCSSDEMEPNDNSLAAER